jgi:hypothetical protein
MKRILTAITLFIVSSVPAFAAQSGGVGAMPIYRCVVTMESGQTVESWVPQTICAQKGGKTHY